MSNKPVDPSAFKGFVSEFDHFFQNYFFKKRSIMTGSIQAEILKHDAIARARDEPVDAPLSPFDQG